MKRSEKHICALVNNNYGTIRIDKDHPVWQRQPGTLFCRDGKIRSNRHQSGSSARPDLLCVGVRPWWRGWRSPFPHAIMIACLIGVSVMFSLVLWAGWICDRHGPFYVEVEPEGGERFRFPPQLDRSDPASNTVNSLYIWLCLLSLPSAWDVPDHRTDVQTHTKDEVNPPCSQRGSRRVPEASDGVGVTMVECDEGPCRCLLFS